MVTTVTEKPTTKQEITAKVGQSFEIKLEENAGSTGYMWALTKLPENFYLLSDSFVPGEPMPGAPGIHHFNFVAMKPAKDAVISFYLLRSWEPSTPAEKSDWLVKAS